jgi:hypothetical protein
VSLTNDQITIEEKNLFVSKLKKDKNNEFEFENNRMMDVKLRNITEMGMVESLENNMFGFNSQNRCVSQDNTERLSNINKNTKMKLI